MQHAPNIFRHATSELSQDAFLAWLCEWADEAHASHPSGMHAIGRAFIAWLYQKKGWPPPEYRTVEVDLQYLHIDLFLTLTTAVGEKHYLLIEDKTYTSDYAEQISGYLNALKHKGGIHDLSRVLPVYFKTSLELRKNDEHLRLYLPDIAGFLGSLDTSAVRSEIFHSWCDLRLSEHASHEKFRSLPVAAWQADQWYACFDHMAQEATLAAMDADYGYIPRGDFIGFTLGWVGEPNDWCTYLQVDAMARQKPSLYFRIGAPKGVVVDKARMEVAYSALEKTAASVGKQVQYPKWPRGGGKSSRFAVLNEPFLSSTDEGTFEEALFVKQLVSCKELLTLSEAHLKLSGFQ